MSPEKDTTHFGFTEVPVTEKAQRVRGVFDSVATRYDLMNDLMSLGIHRVWKRFTIEKAGLRPGMQVLDLAGGTGDLAALMAPRVTPGGRVVLSDINEAMLRRGRERLLDRGVAGENIEYCLADAEALPFEDARFDVVTIAFGLRNVADRGACLAELGRVLRPRGRLVILAVALLVVLLPGAWRAMATAQVEGPSTIAVTVAPGDTLWGIASQIDPGADPRALIAEIRELNALAQSGLLPGQQLQVPTR